jgi:OmpA-OmpF porin, OOP family
MKLQVSTAVLVAATAAASVAFAADPAYRTQVDPSVSFPSPSGSWIPQGTFVNPGALRQVTPGLSKAQLYPLLGPPHFSNPWPFVRTWNYIFDFHTGDGDAVVQCQYQIRFEGSPPRVKATYWKDAGCENYLYPPPPPPKPPAPLPPEPKPVPPPKQASNLTVYFAFDKADLTPDAQAVIADAATRAKADSDKSIVVGFTDTSGSAAYNLGLSERRAKAVADELVAQGVPADSIDVSWRGKTDLAVPTPDGVKEPLNRRATIRVQPTE